ncbi:hypothetical protein TNCV_3487891 [Trichonephila clavipes]|nr:hypothetical protein TNCV_3487891 [Trichonephila clavipes]
MFIQKLFIPFDKIQKALKEKLRALHMEETFFGLFVFSIASKAPSGQILLLSRKQMRGIGARSGLYGKLCRHSQPRVAVRFCVAVTECSLGMSSSNRTLDLRTQAISISSVGHEFHPRRTILFVYGTSSELQPSLHRRPTKPSTSPFRLTAEL